MLIVEKLPWANTLDVTRGVEHALESLKPGLPGLEIDTDHLPAGRLHRDLAEEPQHALLIGCLLMIFMLFIFLYYWRVALISVVAIPLSLLAAAMVLNWRGTTINTMVLAGLAIAVGDVVDDAIIDIENVVRRLREHRQAGSGRSTAGVILNASLEVRGAIVYATLIEVVAVVPIFFLDGLSGAFFRPLVTSYALALHGVDGRGPHGHAGPGADLPAQGAAGGRGIAARRVAAAGLRLDPGPVSSASAGTPSPRSPPSCCRPVGGAEPRPVAPPDFKERDFLMHFLTKPGTSLGEEVRITQASAKELAAIPGSETSAPTSARPTSRTSRWGRNSARTGSASTPRSTTTRRSPRSRRSWTLPRPDHRRPDLPEGADPGGAGRHQPSDRHPDPGPGLDVLRSKAKELSAALQTSPASRTRRSRTRRSWPRSRSRRTWPPPSATG